MKKIIRTLLLSSSLLALAGCYDPYVKDYEYSAVYVANQYDLRSLVVGEGMKFDFGVVLGGVMNNADGVSVRFMLDDELVTEDLSSFGGDTYFTALAGMLGNAPIGTLSQRYVTDAFSAPGASMLEPLPASHFKLSSTSDLSIAKGAHTGTVTFKADSLNFLSDEKAGADPHYAIGYRIVSSSADTVLLSKSFGVIALRCENMFFGNWYHGGKSKVTSADGQVSESAYPTRIPADENTSEVYSLVTATPYSVKANFFHNQKGKTMTISSEGGQIAVSAPDGSITDLGSSWNKSKLLQDRKLFLNYSYTSADGSVTEVHDTLAFRNRIRDGVNEWQDDNPSHYQK